MACTLQVAWDDQLTAYDFGARHPMTPVRVELTIELARAFGLFAQPEVSVERPAPATDVQLEMVHRQQYIAAVRRAGGPEPDPSVLDFGLGTDDDPVFSGMHDAAALVAGATLFSGSRGLDWRRAARREHRGRAASRDARQGERFLRVQRPGDRDLRLLAAGAQRVAYVDIDAHHGDGCRRPSTTIRGC